jgi:hypothetical protein
MKHALALGAILAVFVLLARREIFTWPYYYDEADYMFAASLGLSANWLDRPSQPLTEFIRVGLRDGADPSKRAELSVASRDGSDVSFYRHWHGPLYFYWLAALNHCHLGEPATRTVGYVLPLLTALVLYFAALWLEAAPGAPILAAVLYLWSYATVFSNEIAPHQLFVLCSMVSLILLMKWRARGRRRFWYASVVAAACAFSTLEVAFVLVLTLVVCAGRAPGIVKPVGLFLLGVAALWPAALLKLSFVKAYLFMSYLVLFRGSAWGHVGLIETWNLRWMQSPGQWLLLAAAGVVYFCFSDPAARRLLAPAVLFGCLMLFVLLRVNSDTPRYMLPFLAPFQFAAGCALASAMQKWKAVHRRAAVAAIVLLVFSDTFAQIQAHPVLPSPRMAAVLDTLRAANLDGKSLLAPQNDVPMIHYYLPRTNARATQPDPDAVLSPGYPVDLWRRTPDAPH